MKNNPLLKCKRCGELYTFSLSTTDADVEGEQLYQFMAGVLEDHLCGECQAQHTWYIQQGRGADWEAGRP